MKSTDIANRMARADGGGAAIGAGGPDSLPWLVLRHSPQALRWVRRQRGWTKAELAHASGLAVRTIGGLENGSRSAGPVALAKLAEALGCPQVVLEAGQINAVAASAVSALDLLDRLLQISYPARLTRRRGFVRLGFVASGHHIGTLHVQEKDFDELMNALRRHFPNRGGATERGTGHGLSGIHRQVTRKRKADGPKHKTDEKGRAYR
jgi:transcriptional regulator with XRE-family HTH domain